MVVLWIIVGLVAGGAGSFVLQQTALKAKSQKLIKEAEIEAENTKKERVLQAKEKFLKLKEEHETLIKDRERKLQANEDRVRSKEKSYTDKLEHLGRKEKEIEKIQTEFDAKFQALEVRLQDVDKIQQKRVAELSKISNMSVEDAKNMLMEDLKDEARTAAMASIKEITEEAKLNANKEARKIVIQSIQRVATEQAIENAVSVFNIESDEVKGRII
ncbi:MAG: Rnase Y domain-containing protein, partial [Crocinitomicaceae bacterium]